VVAGGVVAGGVVAGGVVAGGVVVEAYEGPAYAAGVPGDLEGVPEGVAPGDLEGVPAGVPEEEEEDFFPPITPVMARTPIITPVHVKRTKMHISITTPVLILLFIKIF
jgi:hypothetical protein